MKTWNQLERLAADDRLKLFRTKFGVTIFTIGNIIESAFCTITAGDLDDEDADKLLRASTETALRALKELNP